MQGEYVICFVSRDKKIFSARIGLLYPRKQIPVIESIVLSIDDADPTCYFDVSLSIQQEILCFQITWRENGSNSNSLWTRRTHDGPRMRRERESVTERSVSTVVYLRYFLNGCIRRREAIVGTFLSLSVRWDVSLARVNPRVHHYLHILWLNRWDSSIPSPERRFQWEGLSNVERTS